MTKYDYLVEEIYNRTKLQEYLDQYGEMGYRLACPPMKVGQQTYRIIMERKVEDDA